MDAKMQGGCKDGCKVVLQLLDIKFLFGFLAVSFVWFCLLGGRRLWGFVLLAKSRGQTEKKILQVNFLPNSQTNNWAATFSDMNNGVFHAKKRRNLRRR